jgi:hypothetical protein
MVNLLLFHYYNTMLNPKHLTNQFQLQFLHSKVCQLQIPVMSIWYMCNPKLIMNQSKAMMLTKEYQL